MLGFRLDRRSNVVPYLQLVEQVHQAASDGPARTKDQLPTVREVTPSRSRSIRTPC